MIYTVTLNPSIDHIVETNEIQVGNTNRAVSESFLPGGKGINVSFVLKQLEISSTALGFVGGFTGDFIASKLKDANIETDFISLSNDFTRINTKLKEHTKCLTETEINTPGPVISENEWKLFLGKLDALTSQDYLVLSGSIPRGVPENAYDVICEAVNKRGAKLIVDTSGESLCHALKHRPFLVKPNKAELEEVLQVQILDKKMAGLSAKKLIEMGAENVIVSMGNEGAVLVTKSGAYDEIDAFKGELVNSVGAGDSLVAGFLAYLSMTMKQFEKVDDLLLKNAFRYGVCAASASAFSLGFATKEDTDAFFAKCKYEGK